MDNYCKYNFLIHCYLSQVRVSHQGRPVELDLDSAEVHRCAILALPPASIPIAVSPTFAAVKANEQGDGIIASEPQQETEEEASVAVEFSRKSGEGGIISGDHTCGDPVVNADIAWQHARRVRGGRDGSGATRSREFSSSVEGGESSFVTPSGENKVNRRREVPMRIVAVLVDGAGKGWLAARRLWSLREVRMEPLTLDGLTLQDLDLNQEASIHMA